MVQLVLSLGSNIDREKNIRYAVQQLAEQFGELTVSPVYLAQAVGFEGPDFYNLVVAMQTSIGVDAALVTIHAIEAGAGRLRGEKSYGSRTLDIDILLYNGQNLQQQGRNIPRDEIETAAYVLKPLLDILPDGSHPVTGRNYNELWLEFDPVGSALLEIEFDLGLS